MSMKTPLCLLLSVFSLVACADYSLTLNEKTVYNPPGIFTDFRLVDLPLQVCTDQTLAEERITAANKLVRLQCPDKGIQSVEGIAVFTELKVLGLEKNRVREIAPLGKLQQLEQLNLAANNIRDITPLFALTKLHYLDLRQNPELNCEQLAGVTMLKEGKLLHPEHCKPSGP